MRIFYFSLLYAVTCNDIELEGILRMGENFLQKLNENPSISDLIQHTKQFPMIKQPEETMISPAKDASRKSNNWEVMIFQNNYLKRITKKSVSRFKHISNVIKVNFKVKTNISNAVNTATGTFLAKIKKYFNFISRRNAKTKLDEEFIFLDIIDTVNKLLYSTERKLFHEFVDKNDTYRTEADKEFTLKSYRDKVEHKKEEMKYLCKEINICRAYPSFSDYFADFCSEILKLPQNKFDEFIILTWKKLKQKEHSFKYVIEYDALQKLSLSMGILGRNMENMKRFVSVIRSTLTQRHKILDSTDATLVEKTLALRILLDIIDKAFLLEDDELINMLFDSTATALRDWGFNRRDDLDNVLSVFINYIIGIINYNWTLEARDEVKALTKFILLGPMGIVNTHKYLLSEGSKYVHSESFDSKVELKIRE